MRPLEVCAWKGGQEDFSALKAVSRAGPVNEQPTIYVRRDPEAPFSL